MNRRLSGKEILRIGRPKKICASVVLVPDVFMGNFTSFVANAPDVISVS